jgi:hypothetical protein
VGQVTVAMVERLHLPIATVILESELFRVIFEKFSPRQKIKEIDSRG